MRRESGWLVLVLIIVAVSAGLYRARGAEPQRPQSPRPTVTAGPPTTVGVAPPTGSTSPAMSGQTPTPGAIPADWFALAKGHRPGQVSFISGTPSWAVVTLTLESDGSYSMSLTTDAVDPTRPGGVVLRRGRFTLDRRHLALHQEGKPDLVFRIEYDNLGPLLLIDRGDLGTTDPYVVLPLSFDGRRKGGPRPGPFPHQLPGAP